MRFTSRCASCWTYLTSLARLNPASSDLVRARVVFPLGVLFSVFRQKYQIVYSYVHSQSILSSNYMRQQVNCGRCQHGRLQNKSRGAPIFFLVYGYFFNPFLFGIACWFLNKVPRHDKRISILHAAVIRMIRVFICMYMWRMYSCCRSFYVLLPCVFCCSPVSCCCCSWWCAAWRILLIWITNCLWFQWFHCVHRKKFTFNVPLRCTAAFYTFDLPTIVYTTYIIFWIHTSKRGALHVHIHRA